MDDVDDAEESLDPRIQIELENLNNATDDINKLETELDEAHTAFRQLLSETTRRLKEILDKLGSACIEKARCYYKALDVARQAQIQCQQQAQLFQRASEIHAAAKETVALAEARFMSHQHEWNFDQAWQDMLNHATIKVMDAEHQKAECGREHHKKATLFHEAEKKLLQLEEKHRRSIIKARPYFEVKAQCDQMLATQKERVECLQRAVKDAKRVYATSLHTLEEISNQIHQQRRDYDIVANGPREPGVGAELNSPGSNISYEVEFNQTNINRINSTTTDEFEKSERTHNFQGIFLPDQQEHIAKRSVDGSESTSTQWELELQASMEKLNNLSVDNPVYSDSDEENKKNIATNSLQHYDEDVKFLNLHHGFPEPGKSSTNTLLNFKKSPDFQNFRKSLSGMSLMSHFPGLRSVISNPVNSMLLNTPNMISNDNTVKSKSLDSSPVNTNAQNTEKLKGITTYMPNNVLQLKKQKYGTNSNISYHSANSASGCQTQSNDCLTNISDMTLEKNLEYFEQSQQEISKKHSSTKNVQSKYYSADSTPIKVNNSLTSSTTKSSDDLNDLNNSILKRLNKTSSVKELPLLSLFKATTVSSINRDKSCSMVDLSDRQSLKILLDNSNLANIQSISVGRLANARHNLINNTLLEKESANK